MKYLPGQCNDLIAKAAGSFYYATHDPDVAASII